MKKVIGILLVLLVVAGNAHAGLLGHVGELLGIESAPAAARAQAASEGPQELAVWLLGTPAELDNPDAEISARLGWRNDDTEFGCQFDAVGIHGENDEAVGLYGLLWLGEAYVGYAGTIASEDISYGPVAGTVLDFLVVEYRYRSFSGEHPLGGEEENEHQLYAGLRIPF